MVFGKAIHFYTKYIYTNCLFKNLWILLVLLTASLKLMILRFSLFVWPDLLGANSLQGLSRAGGFKGHSNGQ